MEIIRVFVCSQEDYDKWKKEKLLFDSTTRTFISDVELNEDDAKLAKEEYAKNECAYWKKWDELTDEERKAWYMTFVSYDLQRHNSCNGESYVSWENNVDSMGDMNTFTSYQVTPKGEEIVVFGYYGQKF